MTKEELRRNCKELRQGIGIERKKEWDAALLRRLVETPAFRRAKTIFLFAPMEGEVNVSPLVKYARSRGKTVAFPKCDPAKETMDFFILSEGERLLPGAFGIYEPPEGAPRAVADAKTLCIVPGLAFDRAGNRLGYGKGYYDKFLDGFPGVSIGVAYEAVVFDTIPTDALDRPVQLVLTESATYGTLAPTKFEKTLTSAKGTLEKFWEQVKREGTEPIGERKFRPLPAPPVLAFAAFLILSIVRLFDRHMGRVAEAILIIPFQLLAFGAPLVVFYFLGYKGLFRRLRLQKFRPSNLWFLASVLLTMLSGSLFFSILTGGISSLDGRFTLYSTFVANMGGNFFGVLYVILAFAVVPAVCEEVFFRGVLCPFYERFGVGVSVFVGGFFFALLHGTFPLFLTYLLLGVLLSFSVYATGSLYPAVGLHFLYNMFCLFGQPYLSDFYVNAGNTAVFIFLVTVIFLLSLALTLGQARKIYHRYAKEGKSSTFAEPLPIKEYPRALLKVLFTPGTLACILLWLIVCFTNL